MKKILFAALLASAVAVPAHAADFLIYGFNATGTTYNQGNDPTTGVFTPNSSARILYYLPLGQYATDQVRVGPIGTAVTTIIGPPVSSYSYSSISNSFGAQDTRTSAFSATTTTLSFSEASSSTASRSGTFRVNGSVCGAFGGVFPAQGSATDPACSNVSITQTFNSAISGGSIIGFNGTISSFDVTEGFGAPPSIGVRLVPSIPEPATWAMLLMGFGAIGGAMRRRRTVAVSYA